MSHSPLRTPTWIHRTAVPLFLMLATPPAVFIFWFVNTQLSGSFETFFRLCIQNGPFATFYQIWRPVAFGSSTAWAILGIFAAFQLLLMRLVPGKPFLGPVTPQGNIPEYKANGPASFLITLSTYWLAAYPLALFNPALLYDQLGFMLGALNIVALAFCLFLYLKGILKPSSSDCGISGNPIFDYYWGTELYPRVFGWDVKQFTNCRFGMMIWPVLLLSYAAKQHQLYGLSDSMTIAVLLQLLYIGKFYFWETGYLRSLDIMHDRAGYYICWGCLVWVPGIYTASTLYLVNHPNHLGWALSSLIFSLGAFSIAINYLADRQRQHVRARNGDCLVWGKKPHLIEAPYKTEQGEAKQSVLLASGWWGLSRHFHYIPELFASFFWALPALFSNFSPYFYVVYLTILLMDRAWRHDKRCLDKYGNSWQQYCQKVPYKLIPFLY